jgi:protein-tyrosine-phosphatase
MAEALLRHRLGEIGVDVRVSSVGSLFDDRPAEPAAVAALARLDIDLGDHRARRLSPEIVGPADLVVAMEQRHVREVSMVPGGSFEKTFTLPDLVARAEASGPRGTHPAETFSGWLGRLGAGRTRADAMATRPDLEIDDPMGLSPRRFRRSATEIAALIDRFVALAWPDAALTPTDERPDSVAGTSPHPDHPILRSM